MSNSIQLSFEIATSISIMGAVFTFIWSHIGQSKKARVLLVKQQRIKQMSLLIAEFATILDDGDLMLEKSISNESQTGPHDFNYDYICFCKTVERYIHVHSKLLFEVWASQDEKNILKHLQKIVMEKRIHFINNSSNSVLQTQNNFTKLVNEVENNIKRLSTLLRLDVENIHR